MPVMQDYFYWPMENGDEFRAKIGKRLMIFSNIIGLNPL
jgi:hypothetical protein